MAKKDFTILLLHGHGSEWKRVKLYIEERGYTARVMIEELGRGILFSRFRKIVWNKAHCAVVVMTRDDKIAEGGKDSYRARQNVVFELGYCFGAFDSLGKGSKYKAKHAVIVIEEEGVQRFANIEGLLAIRFQPGHIKDQKDSIQKTMDDAYKRARKVYPELQ